ncbi:MAG: outer membrane beta-barrel protein [Acidobacteria bacterium]|nr:outer membrane beta-barrel protein [Acidobacteriota bacterium]
MTMHAPSRAAMRPASWLAAALVALTGAAPALAQAPTENARAFITINGGMQALTTGFSEQVVFQESGGVYREVLSGAAAHEEARFESDYRFETGTLYDVSGGVRIWSYLGVGVGVSRFEIEETASVSAQVPHPIFFNRDRSISGASPPLARSERAVHLQALVAVPASRSFTVTVFGGPTFFDVQQQLVTDVNFTHAYPYDMATFSSAAIDRESGSTVGFNVGADVAYYFTGNVGIGWLTRYSRGMLELPSVSDDTLDIETGGLHTAVGLRLRF